MSRRAASIVVILTAGAGASIWHLGQGRVTASPDGSRASERIASESRREIVAIDDRRQQLSGVRLVRTSRGSLTRGLRAVASVKYDETRLTDINLKLDGWIRDLYVSSTGQRVRKGDPLLTLDSPDLVSAQTQFLSALRNRDLSSAEQPEFADRLIETPRERLVRWDVPQDQLRLIEDNRRVLPSVVFRSPATGVVVERAAVKGMHVEAGQTLYKVADLSTVWVEADFYESDIRQLRIGARAAVHVDAWPGERFIGRIVHVYPYVAEETRTIKTRVELSNRHEKLKPGMFANVEVDGLPQEGLLVPADAVLDSGSRQIVFVSQGDGYFEPREVSVGDRSEGQALIRDGLRGDEEVVARAAFLVDSESQLQSALTNYRSGARTPTMAGQTPLQMTVQVRPDPPRAGQNEVDVTIRDPRGRPPGGLEVTIHFMMPAMPAMNMPAMHAETHLAQVDTGLYRGHATLPMAGRWDVTVSALRQGQLIGVKRESLVVR
jgi:Cu(I)/Ag(I) efflux system membrane fusion protein/cobalt-zinc-cadmium efflux system membrane fusion protein